MGLFDYFSADTSTPRRVAKALNNATNTASNTLGNYYSGANNTLTSGTNAATNYLQTGQNTANNVLTGAYDTARGDINQGLTQGINYLNDAQGYLGQAIDPWRTLTNIGTEGLNQYGNVVGLNGQAAATAAYQGSPGYQWQLAQGLDALNRTANSRGMLTSGNNTQDILKYSQGLAGQDYFNYLNALQPYFGLSQNGAQGLSNAYNNLAGNSQNKANLASSAFNNLANVATGYGNNQADIANRYAAAYGGLQTGLASDIAGNQTQLGGLQSALDQSKGVNTANMYQTIANNKAQAGANDWNAILGLAGLGTNLAGQIYKPAPVTNYNYNLAQ